VTGGRFKVTYIGLSVQGETYFSWTKLSLPRSCASIFHHIYCPGYEKVVTHIVPVNT
jgi:hypothetical protein